MKTHFTACGFALCLFLAMTSLARGQDDGVKGEGGPTAVSFDDIKLKLESGQEYCMSLLTEKVKGYDGKTIRIRGYMSPAFRAEGITDFVLIKNAPNKFGLETADEFVRVRMKKGTSTSYTLRPITVEGKFTIKPFKVGKKIWAIYELQAGQVK